MLFFFSSTPVLRVSIDIVFILSITMVFICKWNQWIHISNHPDTRGSSTSICIKESPQSWTNFSRQVCDRGTLFSRNWVLVVVAVLLMISQLDFVWAAVWEKPDQNGKQFADAIYKCIFFNKNTWKRFNWNVFINSSPPSASYMCQWIGSTFVHKTDCCLFGAKPLSEPILGYCQLDPEE